MAKVAREIVEQRPQEIMDACRKLYEKESFQEISLKEISAQTSISRPSIYNYFETKEEIFLAILEEEYSQWADEIGQFAKRDDLTDSLFAELFAASLGRHETMLKIQCMNLYEIEEHSRIERLVSFKKAYRRAFDLTGECFRKLRPAAGEEEMRTFCFTLFPFLYGVYPYVHPTDKQLEAMEVVGIQPTAMDTVALTRCLLEALLDDGHNKRD